MLGEQNIGWIAQKIFLAIKKEEIMSIETYHMAVSLINRYPLLGRFVGPRSELLIQAAEKTIGITFPNTYRRFLLEYGAGNFGSSEIYGIIDEDFMNSGIPDSVWYTMKLRSDFSLPNHLFVIHDVGNGEMVGLNFAKIANDETPVVVFTFESILQKDVLEQVAIDFGDFFLELVELQIKNQDKRNLRI